MTVNERLEFWNKKRDARLRILICDDDSDSLLMIYEKAKAIFNKLNTDTVFDTFVQCAEIA